MNLIEKYLSESFKEGQWVINKKTSKEWKIKTKNNQGGIYCEDKKGRRTWFRETDMKSIKI
jgi:hypothetical protein